jgi:hypothetical protein
MVSILTHEEYRRYPDKGGESLSVKQCSNAPLPILVPPRRSVKKAGDRPPDAVWIFQTGEMPSFRQHDKVSAGASRQHGSGGEILKAG